MRLQKSLLQFSCLSCLLPATASSAGTTATTGTTASIAFTEARPATFTCHSCTLSVACAAEGTITTSAADTTLKGALSASTLFKFPLFEALLPATNPTCVPPGLPGLQRPRRGLPKALACCVVPVCNSPSMIDVMSPILVTDLVVDINPIEIIRLVIVYVDIAVAPVAIGP